MSKNNPLISIVIPTANRIPQLQRLVTSIKKSTYKRYEIIIVNDFRESLPTKLKLQKFKIIENNANKGLAYSRKKGAHVARGKYVLFVDDDNVIEKNMITHLVKTLEENGDVTAVGPVTYYLSNKKKIAFLGAKINLGTSKTTFAQKFDHKELVNGNLFVTGNLHNCFMVRKELGDKVGWFDEKVFMSGTEFDMFQRIKRIYSKMILGTNTQAVCYHDVLDISSNGWSNLVANYAVRKNRIYYFQRNKGLLAARYGTILQKLELGLLFYPFFVGIYSVLFLVKGRYDLFNEGVRGMKDGYLYLLTGGK